MKSLHAWSASRLQEASLQQQNKVEVETATNEIQLSLSTIIAELVSGLALYEASRMQEKQSKNLRTWVVEQSGMLQSTLDDQAKKIRQTLLDSLVQAVGPMLADSIERKAMEDFCSALETVASKSLLSAASISVPSRLSTSLLEELSRRGMDVRLEISQSEELIFEMNESRVETKISTAMAELDGILRQ